MRLLLTRPRPDSEILAARLGDMNIETLIAPVLQIEPLAAELPDIGDDETVLLTSANGARALARASERRDVRLLAVGDATAAAARAAGFSDVTSAERDSDALTRLAIDRAGAEKGRVLHITGSHVAGDMEGSLTAAGLSYRRVALYDAHAAETLPAIVEAALSSGGVDGVILYSPRSAKVLCELLAAAGLGDAQQKMTAYCLSGAVAKAAGEGWQRLAVAKAPDTDSLLALLKPAVAGKAPASHLRRNGAWALVGVLVLALAYAGVRLSEELPVRSPSIVVPVAEPAPAPPPPPVDTSGPRLDAMESRLAMLETLLARRPEAATPDALAALATRFAAESDALRDENRALAAQLSALSKRLAGLESQLARTDEGAFRNGAMLLALGQLRAAVAIGAPYRAAFEALAALAEDDDDIADLLPPLEAAADGGLVDETALQARFPALAQALLQGQTAPEDPDWLDETLAEVEGLISVRRVGEIPGDEAEAVLARAETRLAAGRLAEAVALIEGLGDSEATQPWLDDARATLGARAALDAVSAAVLARAGGSG
jgi:uroporphyrinogen-III synthase